MSSHHFLHAERVYSPFERLVKITDFSIFFKKQGGFSKKIESFTNALMARQERDFSPFERIFSPFERELSAR